jgi:hypothetical protein
LLSERDANGEEAITLANAGKLERAAALLKQVFKIEQSVFGEDHQDLLDTLHFQAEIAYEGKD